jgi:hypothetical protein
VAIAEETIRAKKGRKAGRLVARWHNLRLKRDGAFRVTNRFEGIGESLMNRRLRDSLATTLQLVAESCTMQNFQVLTFACVVTIAGLAAVPCANAQSAGTASISALSSPNLKPSQFSATQRWILNAVGNRLQQPGNESLTITGTLDEYSLAGAKTSAPATATWQYPGLSLIQLGSGLGNVSYNGTSVVSALGTPSQLNLDFTESFVKDSTENFLLGRFSGSNVQLIGLNYNIIDTRTSRLSGQCDLFKVHEVNGVHGVGSSVAKTYCYDPRTHLLAEVSYTISGVLVETRYLGWRVVSGQSVPSAIQRFNNGVLEFTFTLTKVVFGGPQATSVFTTP